MSGCFLFWCRKINEVRRYAAKIVAGIKEMVRMTVFRDKSAVLGMFDK